MGSRNDEQTQHNLIAMREPINLDFKEFPVIETPRLILREHSLSDTENLFSLRTNPEVMRYIDRERPKDRRDIEVFIRNFREGYVAKKHIAWAFALKEKPEEMIGSMGFWRCDFPNFRAEIGYMLHPDYWRQGIVSEAMVACLNFGFETLKLHTVMANINPLNDASRQILTKHGFVKEAYIKEDYYFNGAFLDSEIYGLINPKDKL